MEIRDTESLALVVVSGPEAVERAVFGLASAVAAAASGVDVRVFLDAAGAYWGLVGTGTEELIPGYPTIDELFEGLALLGISVEACDESVDRLRNPSPAPPHAPPHRDGLQPVIRRQISRIDRPQLLLEVGRRRAVIC